MCKVFLAILLLLALACPASADGMSTILEVADQAGTTNDSVAIPVKRNLVSRFLAYFNDANKNKKHRRFDFSVIGGPHYSTDTKFGIGLVAAGLYHSDTLDTALPPSNVSIFSDFSSVGFWLLGIRGTHIFPYDRYRLSYTTYFYSFPADFWGIGYERGNDDTNKIKMKRWQMRGKVDFLWQLTDGLFLGPTLAYDFVRGKNINRPELLNGQDRTTHNLGIGVTIGYDTRDVMTNPHKGVYLSLSQSFRPKFLGNEYAFATTELQLDGYQRLWRGAILAGDFRTAFNFGNPSWSMMALLGNSYSMRGYYEGRYRDKHKMEIQAELRQHVWKRNSLTAWVGAGTVFDKFSHLYFRHLLPNYGVGYRWEFKKDVNVRLDYGFGKAGQSGFMFNINEAF